MKKVLCLVVFFIVVFSLASCINPEKKIVEAFNNSLDSYKLSSLPSYVDLVDISIPLLGLSVSSIEKYGEFEFSSAGEYERAVYFFPDTSVEILAYTSGTPSKVSEVRYSYNDKSIDELGYIVQINVIREAYGEPYSISINGVVAESTDEVVSALFDLGGEINELIYVCFWSVEIDGIVYLFGLTHGFVADDQTHVALYSFAFE